MLKSKRIERSDGARSCGSNNYGCKSYLSKVIVQNYDEYYVQNAVPPKPKQVVTMPYFYLLLLLFFQDERFSIEPNSPVVCGCGLKRPPKYRSN